MTYPMPPELLAQLGLEACDETDPAPPEVRDPLGWGTRVTTTADDGEPRSERSVVRKAQRDR